MKAAVVTAFDSPPRYSEIPAPIPGDRNEILVDVIAAGLHPRVRSQADGSHYTSTGVLPLVPGIDGIGRDSEGGLRYFILDDTNHGSMAEQTVIDTRRSFPLPEHADTIAVAAALNPAMASWMALRRRIDFSLGQRVLILGATGSSGRMAVQVARRLGAGQIVAAARNADLLEALPGLGATDTAQLDDGDQLGRAAGEVDVVLDFLWGEPSANAMISVLTARPDRGKPLSWIQIGSVAGPTAPIPSAALRSSRLQIVGSGQGSLERGDYLEELPQLVREIADGQFVIDAKPMPLAEIGRIWTTPGGTRRIVITPAARRS
ncbi:quinone oxidoreductase family protein [Jongsikchunia kroppenstedtii]|uniref:quinone oxidoreductase family protein n=1 Tax=Jongsikchunia kroppenstedtii TaxID=1121721 RepID=UPI000379ED14|nr:zinc-binding alcohol dehydrogenase family protein [Jongsikchunia kroppenstedtii]